MGFWQCGNDNVGATPCGCPSLGQARRPDSGQAQGPAPTNGCPLSGRTRGLPKSHILIRYASLVKVGLHIQHGLFGGLQHRIQTPNDSNG